MLTRERCLSAVNEHFNVYLMWQLVHCLPVYFWHVLGLVNINNLILSEMYWGYLKVLKYLGKYVCTMLMGSNILVLLVWTYVLQMYLSALKSTWTHSWLYSKTSDSGHSDKRTLYNKPLNKGYFSISQIIGLPIVFI